VFYFYYYYYYEKKSWQFPSRVKTYKTTNDCNEWKELKKKTVYTTDQSLSYFKTGPWRCNRLRWARLVWRGNMTWRGGGVFVTDETFYLLNIYYPRTLWANRLKCVAHAEKLQSNIIIARVPKLFYVNRETILKHKMWTQKITTAWRQNFLLYPYKDREKL